MLRIIWTQTAGPTVVLSDATDALPSFTAPSELTTLTFQPVVTDDAGEASEPDAATVSVIDAPIDISTGRLVLVAGTWMPLERTTLLDDGWRTI